MCAALLRVSLVVSKKLIHHKIVPSVNLNLAAVSMIAILPITNSYIAALANLYTSSMKLATLVVLAEVSPVILLIETELDNLVISPAID